MSRLKVQRVEDPYVRGICCEKLGVTELVRSQLTWNDEEKMRLFNKGVDDAELMSMWNIQKDLYDIYTNEKEGFIENVKSPMREQAIDVIHAPFVDWKGVTNIERVIMLLAEMSAEARAKRELMQ